MDHERRSFIDRRAAMFMRGTGVLQVFTVCGGIIAWLLSGETLVNPNMLGLVPILAMGVFFISKAYTAGRVDVTAEEVVINYYFAKTIVKLEDIVAAEMAVDFKRRSPFKVLTLTMADGSMEAFTVFHVFPTGKVRKFAQDAVDLINRRAAAHR